MSRAIVFTLTLVLSMLNQVLEAKIVQVGKTLVINVMELRSHKGNLMLYLWSNPDSYLNKHTADYRVIYDLEKVGNAPVNGVVRIQIDELKSQVYAIMAYHDENRTYNFERNFIGVPLEGFAFGNNAQPALGAPKFQEAAVDFTSTNYAEQKINIVYK